MKAYEFKLRVTIAASGQGRWKEELDFPSDCNLEFPTNRGQSLAVGLVVRPLELGRGDVPQRRVPADAVLERLNRVVAE